MKPKPIWERWLKDPKKAEKAYTIFWITMVAVNIMIVIGFILFVIFLVRR